MAVFYLDSLPPQSAFDKVSSRERIMGNLAGGQRARGAILSRALIKWLERHCKEKTSNLRHGKRVKARQKQLWNIIYLPVGDGMTDDQPLFNMF